MREQLADYTYKYTPSIFKKGKLFKDGFSDETWIFETVEDVEQPDGEIVEVVHKTRKKVRRTYNSELGPINPEE